MAWRWYTSSSTAHTNCSVPTSSSMCVRLQMGTLYMRYRGSGGRGRPSAVSAAAAAADDDDDAAAAWSLLQ
jgi:hypothetical protein